MPKSVKAKNQSGKLNAQTASVIRDVVRLYTPKDRTAIDSRMKEDLRTIVEALQAGQQLNRRSLECLKRIVRDASVLAANTALKEGYRLARAEGEGVSADRKPIYDVLLSNPQLTAMQVMRRLDDRDREMPSALAYRCRKAMNVPGRSRISWVAAYQSPKMKAYLDVEISRLRKRAKLGRSAARMEELLRGQRKLLSVPRLPEAGPAGLV